MRAVPSLSKTIFLITSTLFLFHCEGALDSPTDLDHPTQDLLIGRDPAVQAFVSSSPWNTPIGSAAVYGDPTTSAGCSNDIRATSLLGQPLQPDINAALWSHPVFVAAPTDPSTSIQYYDPSNYINTTFSIRLPTNALPGSPVIDLGGDAHMHIINETHQFVDEMWHVAPPKGKTGWVTQSRTHVSLYGNGWSDGGERAYGGSAIAGLMRTAELQVGVIPHVLAVGIDSNQLALGPVWPATQQDDDAAIHYKGHVHMGQLLAIRPNAVMPSGLTIQGQAIFAALQKYGAYVVDTAEGGPTLFSEPDADKPTRSGNALDPVRADLRKIWPLVNCVANNSPSAVGGGGSQYRAASWAEPLSGSILVGPDVKMITPKAGQTISGRTVTLSVSGHDAQRIAGLQFTVDSKPLGNEISPSAFPSYPTDSTASLVLDSTTLTNGTHTVGVSVRNAVGSFTTASVAVTVMN